MSIFKKADQALDEEHWLEARKPLMTSSDIFKYRGVGVPDYMESPAEVGEFKLNSIVNPDLTKDFPLEARRGMNHGISDEDGIRKKLEVELGCVSAGDHGLYTNSRWPNLGASIDGWGLNAAPHLAKNKYAQDPENMKEISEYLADYVPQGAAFLIEVKKSLSGAWKKGVPSYYLAQQMTQMAILECPISVIVVETSNWLKPEGENRKRPFWDLQATITHYDEAWGDVLDDLEERWFHAKGERGLL